MQASMWGILLCAVGVAALTSRYKRGSAVVKLGEPQLIDSVSVRLPRDWKSSSDGTDALRVREGRDARLQRVIIVRERDPDNISFWELLKGGPTMPTARPGAGIPVGPVTGTLSSTRTESRRYEDAADILVQAIARLPNDHLLTITLGGVVTNDQDELDAIELVKLIAKNVDYVPAKEMSKDGK